MCINPSQSGRSAPRLHHAAIAVLCLLCAALSLSAQSPVVVLYTGHLNADCIEDTIRGRSTGLHTYLPDLIVWGRPSAHQPCPDTLQGGHSSQTPVPVTPFLYPDWTELRGSVALQRYNSNDSLDDLVLFLWGRVADAEGRLRDTARALVIFGQRDLDLQRSIHLDSIVGEFQSAPFFAMDLRMKQELVNPAERDVTGELSYELLPANRQVIAPDTGNPPHPIGTPPDSIVTTVHIYPNPAELWARLQAEPLAPGEYTITVMAVNGEVYHTQSVQIAAGRHLERELDLSSLPSGYYVVRLHSTGRFVASYPITIVR